MHEKSFLSRFVQIIIVITTLYYFSTVYKVVQLSMNLFEAAGLCRRQLRDHSHFTDGEVH